MRLIAHQLNEFEPWLRLAVPSKLFAVVSAAGVVAASAQGTFSTIVLKMELTARDR